MIKFSIELFIDSSWSVGIERLDNNMRGQRLLLFFFDFAAPPKA